MKFSIATPTLNSLEKLRSCVGSIRGQLGVTYEHLVQDALSGDGTGTWLAGQSDILAVSERDASMYDAIERGWRRATGDVFSWLNSDEQYLPGTLRLVADAFERYPEVDFIYGNSIIVDASGNPVAARREIPLRHVYVCNGTLYAYSCSMFFRKRLFEEGSLAFDPSLRFAADADMVLRLLAAKKRHLHLDRYLSLFMLDGGNLSCSPKMLEEICRVQNSNGALSSRFARRLILACRSIEKLFKGCFSRVDVRYKLALNETPNYRDVLGRRLPTRFDINQFSLVQS